MCHILLCPLLCASAQLTAAVLSVAEAALSVLDLRSHAADHPRLGVLDHVSLHPLGQQATLQHAADAATGLGQQLAAAPFRLPVYYYGAAHPAGRRLAEIRRQLGEQRLPLRACCT
jgi:glutamate formiminotransferase